MDVGDIIRWVVSLVLFLSVAACHRIQPVYTVQDHAVPGPALGLGADQISQIIAQTAQTSGWLVDRISSTELRATQKWRDHSATVRITNTDRTFSIRNDGSTNLKQQGDDSIHRSYNSRVQALENAIEKRLYRGS